MSDNYSKSIVIPVKTEVQLKSTLLDSRLHGNDKYMLDCYANSTKFTLGGV